jgi:hypothetical protein
MIDIIVPPTGTFAMQPARSNKANGCAMSWTAPPDPGQGRK